ncbi:hypothetical protein ACF0H5_018549 [Mactra antiquata]
MIFRVIVWVLMVSLVDAQSYENVTSLKNAILMSYDGNVVPMKNQSEVLNINLTLNLFSLLEMDQVRGAAIYDIELKCEWYDEIIQWDPANYNGISQLHLSSKDVWTPPMVISNALEFSKLDQSWMNVMYESNGHASIAPGTTVVATCSFNMKYWPFDKQQCHMSFVVFGYFNSDVTLSVSEQAVNTIYFVKNSEWTLLTESITYDIVDSCNITVVNFNFKIVRQASFYLLTVILPINGIVALTSLVFLLPNESGERVSYSITIMLSLAVFLTVTADSLPKTADPAPLLCVYILCSLVICIVGLFLVILNMKIYYRSESMPVSSWYKSLVRISRLKFRPRRRNKVQNIRLNEDLPPTPKKKTTKECNWTSGKDISQLEPPLVDEGDEINENVSWKEVSEAIDKIMFYSLVIVTYIPSIIVIVYIAMASDFQTEEK